MKYITSTLFVLLFLSNLRAQTEFMPIGSRLTTEARSFGFYGTATFTGQKDTICDGKPSRKVEITYKSLVNNNSFATPVFFQQRGDSIFEYSEYTKKTVFLFKNKYAVGDSFLIQSDFITYKVTESTIYIDSVIALNGIKRYACRIKCRAINGGNPEFTTRFNLYDKFIPDHDWYVHSICKVATNDGLYYTPLCYTDKVTNYKSVHYTGSCDSIARNNLTNIVINPDVKIFPNPADSYLTVTSDLAQTVTLSIKNMNGVEVIQQKLLTPNFVDTRNLPNGIYILTAQSDKGFSTTQKLIVHH
jgi:hypothetical protein